MTKSTNRNKGVDHMRRVRPGCVCAVSPGDTMGEVGVSSFERGPLRRPRRGSVRALRTPGDRMR